MHLTFLRRICVSHLQKLNNAKKTLNQKDLTNGKMCLLASVMWPRKSVHEEPNRTFHYNEQTAIRTVVIYIEIRQPS